MNPLMIILALFFAVACKRSGQSVIITDKGDCENAISINAHKFSQPSPSAFQITKAAINGDCLEISISAGGCNGSTWQAAFVTNGAVAESFPPQMYFKVLLTNNEMCYAMPVRKFSYNLKPLRISGMQQVVLNVQGWNGQLIYQY